MYGMDLGRQEISEPVEEVEMIHSFLAIVARNLLLFLLILGGEGEGKRERNIQHIAASYTPPIGIKPEIGHVP